jgi:hypothetical protein
MPQVTDGLTDNSLGPPHPLVRLLSKVPHLPVLPMFASCCDIERPCALHLVTDSAICARSNFSDSLKRPRIQNPIHLEPPFISFTYCTLYMFLLPLHRLTSQYIIALQPIANNRAYGITPSMIRLAFIPNPIPQVDAYSSGDKD